jgi:hypothetical protein
VELDASLGAAPTLDHLRAAALEAGIAAAAFDQAVRELQAEAPSPTKRTLGRSAAANLAAIGAFWLSLVVLARIARVFDVGWEIRALADIAALALGAIAAHRFRARLARTLLLGLGASQLAAWIIRLIWGIGAAQGAGNQFAVIGAGVLGALAAAWAAERRAPYRSPMTAHPPVAPPASAESPMSTSSSTRAYIRVPRPAVTAPSVV